VVVRELAGGRTGAEAPAVVLRSGVYVAFDHGLYAGIAPGGGGQPGGELVPAAGSHVSALDDQHAYVRLPPSAGLAPGDLVCLGVSHPCTTFDKWRVIPVVDDGYHVIDAVHTFF